MAFTFDDSTWVLDMRPNAFPLPEPKKYGKKDDREKRRLVYLLWPAFVRQLLVQRPLIRRFNLFQTHVFRLCCAGVRTKKDLSKLLLPGDPSDPHGTGPLQL